MIYSRSIHGTAATCQTSYRKRYHHEGCQVHQHLDAKLSTATKTAVRNEHTVGVELTTRVLGGDIHLGKVTPARDLNIVRGLDKVSALQALLFLAIHSYGLPTLMVPSGINRVPYPSFIHHETIICSTAPTDEFFPSV